MSPTGASGSLSFSYTGAGATAATSFSASGAIPSNIDNGLGSGSWAAGSVSPTTNYVEIGAAIPKTSTTWDITVVQIARKTVGTSSISGTCEDEEECTGVFVIFNQGQTDNSFTHYCYLETGSVTISAISSSNISGTFTGSGFCYAPTGTETPFTVTNGSFNVGVTTQLLD